VGRGGLRCWEVTSEKGRLHVERRARARGARGHVGLGKDSEAGEGTEAPWGRPALLLLSIPVPDLVWGISSRSVQSCCNCTQILLYYWTKAPAHPVGSFL
jgi:hypothetical protein